ncbi:hypothetical protein M433DRAFT_159704 [Acidomyces richmondensis BFW]|nr:MAG: hypothetical protein FE78DRAFT_88269 [Acidomyces sp. 'richmondensis']KYG40925.1 hypothetical protein M433DRAFT_159704 [Acidomyces richmondensis BFW]
MDGQMLWLFLFLFFFPFPFVLIRTVLWSSEMGESEAASGMSPDAGQVVEEAPL